MGVTRIAPQVQAGGVTVGTVAAGSYVDVPQAFPKAFPAAPVVVASVYSTSTSGDIGALTASAINVTATGFTVRVFNASGTARSPAVRWVAVVA